jgi:putative transposase
MATFKQDATRCWHVTLVTEFEMPNAPLALANPTAIVGVDLGLHDFAVLSDGVRISVPRFFRQSERTLRRAQRRLSRREKQSRRRLRAKHQAALVHRGIVHQRADLLHKLTPVWWRSTKGSRLRI